MANYERDKDDVRVYDGSEDDEDGEGSHLPVVIIIAILVLAAFGGVVWLAYNQGVARGRNEPVRLATAETANPGSGIKVYQQPAGAEDEDETKPDSKSQQAEPASKQVEPAAAVAASQPAAHVEAAPPKAVVASPPPAALTPAKPQPQPPAVATKPPAQLGLAHPAPEAAAPAAKTVTPKPVATAPAAAPKPVVPPKPVAVPPAPAATIAKPAPSGSYLLQVGAYKSEAEAMAAWKTYQAKHAALLAGFGPDVQRADLGDKGVWYRLRISSFADKDTAAALCERIKAQNGACFLAR